MPVMAFHLYQGAGLKAARVSALIICCIWLHCVKNDVFLPAGAETRTTVPSAAGADQRPSATHRAHKPPHQCARPGERSHTQVWVNTRIGFMMASLVTQNWCLCGKPRAFLHALEHFFVQFFVLFRLIWNLQCKYLHQYHSTRSLLFFHLSCQVGKRPAVHLPPTAPGVESRKRRYRGHWVGGAGASGEQRKGCGLGRPGETR